MKFITDLLKRISSRKFLITIAGMGLVVTFPENAPEIVTLTVGYVAAEGVGDAAERYKAQDVKKAETILEDTKIQVGQLDDYGTTTVDTNTLVPGNEIPAQ